MTLRNMGSQEAIRAADPSAYGAAVFTKKTAETAKALWGLINGVGTPTANMAFRELGKDAMNELLKYGVSQFRDAAIEKSANTFFENLANYFIEQAGRA